MSTSKWISLEQRNFLSFTKQPNCFSFNKFEEQLANNLPTPYLVGMNPLFSPFLLASSSLDINLGSHQVSCNNPGSISLKLLRGNLPIMFMYTFFLGPVKYRSKFLWSRNYFTMKPFLWSFSRKSLFKHFVFTPLILTWNSFI